MTFVKKLLILAAAAAVVVSGVFVAVGTASHDDIDATTVAQLNQPAPKIQKAAFAFPAPTPRTYTIDASCSGYEGQIRQGAAAWNGLTEGGGTPVSCQPGQFDCGGVQAVGCNYNRGQQIILATGVVGDFALLAAHEFGHDWYDHTGEGCMSLASVQELMRTTICSFTGGGNGVTADKGIRVD
ncbi:hypothetical protein D5S17_31910 [Pseudonocardiaceae bacterium YIM PH 21723]|nr:hypothetical protein D5S17_31910 [Pseudonocardiaceae bacterium YIM PH 21723]